MRAMIGRGVRALVAATAIVATLALPAHAVTFGPERRVAGPYTWNPGKSLAVTDTRLLSIWASDCPPPKGVCATDSGPRMGVFVQRSAADARPPSWSKPLRLSPGTVQAERPSIAAEGTTVIASWVTQRSYERYRASGPRVLWIRVSASEGKRWRTPVRITSPSGRVDYPRVAVAKGRLFAVWTNADTGAIRLAWSDDLGAHWAKARIGSTTSRPLGAKEGYAGFPDVGASDTNVAVAWLSTDTGGQQVVTSSSGGDDLASATPTQLTAVSPNDGQHYPAVGASPDPTDPRLVIAYSANDHLELRTFDGSGLAPPTTAFTWNQQIAGVRYDGGYGPAVIPTSGSGIVVAVAACRPNPNVGNPCNPLATGARIDIVYRSSPDGTTWDPALRLTNVPTSGFRVFDEPSIARTGTTQRVSYVRYERTFTKYEIAMRSGT
jgi:hypothetical protein